MGLIRSAYQEFEQIIGQIRSPRGAKELLVETAIDGFPADFTFPELAQICPGVSRIVIHRVLRQLKEKGLLVRVGVGKYATRPSNLS